MKKIFILHALPIYLLCAATLRGAPEQSQHESTNSSYSGYGTDQKSSSNEGMFNERYEEDLGSDDGNEARNERSEEFETTDTENERTEEEVYTQNERIEENLTDEQGLKNDQEQKIQAELARIEDYVKQNYRGILPQKIDKNSPKELAYQWLSLQPKATAQEIISKTRQLSLKIHPDRYMTREAQNQAREIFINIQTAREILLK